MMESPISEWDWEVIPETLFSSAVNHFCADSEQNYSAISSTNNADVDVDSDNPSWVNPNDMSVVVGGSSRKRSRSPATCYYSDSDSDSDSGDRHLLNLIQPHSGCCARGGGGGFSGVIDDEQGENNREVDENESEKKRLAWWKVPIEVFKYWRVSPVWSLSMAAAALMGFLILHRRYLQNIKQKILAIQLNVTADDKKVSQFMSRAARLNEAFSVVERVPIIRPALPAPGMTSWPVRSLR